MTEETKESLGYRGHDYYSFRENDKRAALAAAAAKRGASFQFRDGTNTGVLVFNNAGLVALGWEVSDT